MKLLTVTVFAALITGCNQSLPSKPEELSGIETLKQARAGFETEIVSDGERFPVDVPPDGVFDLISYPSEVGPLAAYVTPDPADGQKHPAIVWITGGDNNSIGDVWSPQPRENDQSARAFREAGIVMMFPSQRGGNENPGEREGFLGEVDDVLAATDYLAGLDYVDPDQIYLGGHSTGGTLAILIAECSDRYKAVFSLGPAASPSQYGGSYVYCDINNEEEMIRRAPFFWLDSVNTPLYVFEGAVDGNWDAAQMMQDENTNPKIKFFKVPGHDHFSVIAPLTEMLAKQITQRKIEVTQQAIDRL